MWTGGRGRPPGRPGTPPGFRAGVVILLGGVVLIVAYFVLAGTGSGTSPPIGVAGGWTPRMRARAAAEARLFDLRARAEAVAHPRDLRVATFNVLGTQSEARRASDLGRLLGTSRNVIGLQEVQDSRALLESTLHDHGWADYQPASGGTELAIAWDTHRFTLVSPGRSREMHPADGAPDTPDPFPSRYTINVVLRDRTTGATVSVYDTHVNQRIDAGGRPLTQEVNWRYAAEHLAWLERQLEVDPADTVLLLGDLNVDARADQATKDPAFVYETVGAAAVSNWQALGTHGLGSHGDRYIDYVDLARTSSTRWRFVDQAVLDGYYSDHRPVLVTLRPRATDHSRS